MDTVWLSVILTEYDFAGDRQSPNQVEIWLGAGDGRFTKFRVYPLSFAFVWMVKTADLNLDGMSDLMITGAPLQPLKSSSEWRWFLPACHKVFSRWQLSNQCDGTLACRYEWRLYF
jgi:hypothetical protein